MSSLQTTLQDAWKWVADHAPHFGLVAAGILLVLIALKAGKGLMRLALVVVGVGAVVGAVYWFLHK